MSSYRRSGGQRESYFARIIDILQRAYCGTVGIEYRHIQSKETKVWIASASSGSLSRNRLTPEIKKNCCRADRAEQFERFLHTKYLGQKRFSLEGCETVILFLDQLVENAGAARRWKT